MDDVVMQTVELGSQWPTLDPFLFCAHHLDRYPSANGRLGPAANLDGRSIGQDFSGRDGWNMYHGSTVPGFPQHPHRGFETVTYVRQGWCDHSDSLGAQARFGEGDVQWLTAGAGIVHSEMFPLFDTKAANPLHLFQIWLNLPATNKMVPPYFSMLWADVIPVIDVAPGVRVTLIAGNLDGVSAATPPPDSWASKADADVGIWHVSMESQSEWTMPPADSPAATRVAYFFEGAATVESVGIAVNTGVVLNTSRPASVRCSDDNLEFLVLQGRPIGEPVVQHGPFVMNDRREVEQAFVDYQRTGFGGWPWEVDDPVHGDVADRFERRVPSPLPHCRNVSVEGSKS